MINISISGDSQKIQTVKKFVVEGLEEEKKRITFALEETIKSLKLYENKYGFGTSVFLKKFLNGEIEENDDTFSWQAESQIADELKNHLQLFSHIEI